MRLERLTPELLDDEQKELAETIGLEAYRKLLTNYAGCRIYIRKPERITKQDRDAAITDSLQKNSIFRNLLSGKF